MAKQPNKPSGSRKSRRIQEKEAQKGNAPAKPTPTRTRGPVLRANDEKNPLATGQTPAIDVDGRIISVRSLFKDLDGDKGALALATNNPEIWDDKAIGQLKNKLRNWRPNYAAALQKYYEVKEELDEARSDGNSKDIERLAKTEDAMLKKFKALKLRGFDQKTKRKDAYNTCKVKVLQYEDFLYYQNPIHRRQRFVKIYRTKAEAARAKRLKLEPVTTHDEWLDKVLLHFDKLGVGSRKHRPNPVGPEQLRAWTPKARRTQGGQGNFPTKRTRPCSLRYDMDAITKRQLEIEEENTVPVEREWPGVVHRTHTERRAAQKSLYTNASGTFFRTDSGLYISAAEKPDDWPTSYDGLGIVKSGIICTNTHNETIHNNFDRKLVVTNEMVESTPWMEETYGRREFHIHRGLSPSSSVNSPPNSPPHKSKKDKDLDMALDEASHHFNVLHKQWPFGENQVMGVQDRQNRSKVPYSPLDILAPEGEIVPEGVNDPSSKANRKKRKRAEFADPELLEEVDGRMKFKRPAPDGWSIDAWREACNIGDDQVMTFGHYGDLQSPQGFFPQKFVSPDLVAAVKNGRIGLSGGNPNLGGNTGGSSGSGGGSNGNSNGGGSGGSPPGGESDDEVLPYDGDLFRQSYMECCGVYNPRISSDGHTGLIPGETSETSQMVSEAEEPEVVEGTPTAPVEQTLQNTTIEGGEGGEGGPGDSA
ncbi:hypothetical protein P154DRAFT_572807 [Amniculicola lignicola CBS 123094]|uniref:Uncharacterized protein n=1 Tax=Amniculicola lignicola CBS 123094 TaxID=1392246 RepID=A0A6A5WS53_9PLEO|nr:hypothetical protein P154DRAFT_572807 [Amniculicola lignicola CBS 123094]